MVDVSLLTEYKLDLVDKTHDYGNYEMVFVVKNLWILLATKNYKTWCSYIKFAYRFLYALNSIRGF
jgi:hypothetical protein